uniref:Uncharacterized protein n=1 Tax=Anopheles christyi TaxID=43041 RepID=A0A182JVF2_9DIPT
MYPPDESQLEEIEPPAPISQRRRAGNDSKRTPPPRRRRPFLPLQTKKNRWEESIDSREAVEESEIATQEAFRRRPFEDTKPTGELRDNLRHGSTEPRAPFRRPAEPVEPYPYDGTYRAPPRNPIEPPGFVPSQKLPQYPYVQERIPPRIVPQEQFYALVPELEAPKQTPAPESTTKASPYSDRLTAFLNRRNINRNDPYTVVRVKATTPSTTITTIREPVTPPSIESLFTFGANPVSYAIPTTSKPSPGLVRNGWDGYDFSFIRKALESKKRLQRERRSWGVKLR